jgi:AAA domain
MCSDATFNAAYQVMHALLIMCCQFLNVKTAAQAPEAETMIALQRHADKILLLGDHCQLPATVQRYYNCVKCTPNRIEPVLPSS